VVVPALVYLAFNWSDPVAVRGWAIPAATDIAFAVAVLAIIGSHLPSALRIFLLTLAVVDDLIAIAIIAFAYSSDINVVPLLLFLLPIALFTFMSQRYRQFFRLYAFAAWVILQPIGVGALAILSGSIILATFAGVVVEVTFPV